MAASWVFNKAMRWMNSAAIGAEDLLAFEQGGDLFLTGRNSISRWYADGADTITHNADGTMRCRKLVLDLGPQRSDLGAKQSPPSLIPNPWTEPALC
jgi:hypothetical protein